MTTARSVLILGLRATVTAFAAVACGQDIAPPPNAPAKVSWEPDTGKLKLAYHGNAIFEGKLVVVDGSGKELGDAIKMERQNTAGDRVEQRLVFSMAQPVDKGVLVLLGTVAGSDEAFPAETMGEAQKRFPFVRNSVGMSRNLRNHAIYDRRWNWVLIGPGDGHTRIVPADQRGGRRTFALEMRGDRIDLVFRPRFYREHHGYKYYAPWTYKTWQGSPTGYCTWWAYRHGFTQETLDGMLALFAEKDLVDFGYDYMQFDDTYQQGNGSCPENWLNWNKKFPGGWQYAVKAIRDAGMKPGIWVHRIHRPNDPHVKDIVRAHPDWFVRNNDGSPVMNRGFHMLDMTNDEAVENMVRKLYRGLKEQGWDYVKIDGTGDLLRAYKNKVCEEFFKSRPMTSPEESLRAWDVWARDELGRDVYILACHTVGNAKNVVGLVDGARLSNDGFQPRTLAQYSHLEGVLWRNDPDHCDVLGTWLMDTNGMMPVFALDAPVPVRTVVRPAICAMAGSVLMVSDKMAVYRDDCNIEGMKRSAPVLTTVPGQLYSHGRRPMEWWLQEIARPFERWSVLARIQWGEKREKTWAWDFKGAPRQEVRFADLGLDADCEYVVCEFWDQAYLGTFKGAFPAPAMDKNDGMDVFAIREARPHPWVVSTTRHISQGGVSLLDVTWDAATRTLRGRSKVVARDPYELTLHLPGGFRVERADVGVDKVEVESRNTVMVDIASAGHHNRCYRNKATQRYIIGGKRGIEMQDLVGDRHSRNNWVRDTCQYRVMPANGLIYLLPHSCGCYLRISIVLASLSTPARGPVSTEISTV